MSNIALQLDRTILGTIDVSEAVIFDTISFLSGNISYNSATGIITFIEPGRYVFNWLISTQSSTSTNGVVFALASSQGDYIEGNSPIKTGEVVGTGILEIISVPVTVSLVNASTNIVYLSTNVPIKSTLVIVQDNDTTTGPTDPVI